MLTRVTIIAGVLGLSLLVAAPSWAQCAKIKDGTITDATGNVVTLGYDQWGYNYQALLFNGYYDDFSRPATPVLSGDKLIMKWNEAWLSNKDCDGDGKLDRHFGFPSYKGSGAWLTNHLFGQYQWRGNTYEWSYFVKIVAVPSDAVLTSHVWYTPSGARIGPALWGEFAIVQEVLNDPGSGDHGLLSKSAVAPGFGSYKP